MAETLHLKSFAVRESTSRCHQISNYSLKLAFILSYVSSSPWSCVSWLAPFPLTHRCFHHQRRRWRGHHRRLSRLQHPGHHRPEWHICRAGRTNVNQHACVIPERTATQLPSLSTDHYSDMVVPLQRLFLLHPFCSHSHYGQFCPAKQGNAQYYAQYN